MAAGDPSEWLRRGHTGDTLASLPPRVCLELLEDVLVSRRSLFAGPLGRDVEVADFGALLRTTLCPLLIKILRSETRFDVLHRCMRLVRVAVCDLRSELGTEVEVFMMLMCRMLEAQCGLAPAPTPAPAPSPPATPDGLAGADITGGGRPSSGTARGRRSSAPQLGTLRADFQREEDLGIAPVAGLDDGSEAGVLPSQKRFDGAAARIVAGAHAAFHAQQAAARAEEAQRRSDARQRVLVAEARVGARKTQLTVTKRDSTSQDDVDFIVPVVLETLHAIFSCPGVVMDLFRRYDDDPSATSTNVVSRTLGVLGRMVTAMGASWNDNDENRPRAHTLAASVATSTIEGGELTAENIAEAVSAFPKRPLRALFARRWQGGSGAASAPPSTGMSPAISALLAAHTLAGVVVVAAACSTAVVDGDTTSSGDEAEHSPRQVAAHLLLAAWRPACVAGQVLANLAPLCRPVARHCSSTLVTAAAGLYVVALGTCDVVGACLPEPLRRVATRAADGCLVWLCRQCTRGMETRASERRRSGRLGGVLAAPEARRQRLGHVASSPGPRGASPGGRGVRRNKQRDALVSLQAAVPDPVYAAQNEMVRAICDAAVWCASSCTELTAQWRGRNRPCSTCSYCVICWVARWVTAAGCM